MKSISTRYSGIRRNSVYRYFILEELFKSQVKMAEKTDQTLFLQKIAIKKRGKQAPSQA